MIIVRDDSRGTDGQIKYTYQWFDETEPSCYVKRWIAGQTSDFNFEPTVQPYEILYLTVKKHQFVLVVYKREGKVREARKIYPETALVWLVNNNFEPPKHLADLLDAKNEI